MRLSTRHCLVAESMKITFGKCKLFSILFSDFLSDEMLNKPKNICNAESFSGISAKTIDYKVSDAYTIALLTKAVTPLQQVYNRHRR